MNPVVFLALPHTLRSAPGKVHLIECGSQSLRKLLGIVAGPKMHEEKPWLVAQHVIVDGRDLDAVFVQNLQDGVHLLGDEHKVVGNGRLPHASVSPHLAEEISGSSHGSNEV